MKRELFLERKLEQKECNEQLSRFFYVFFADGGDIRLQLSR